MCYRTDIFQISSMIRQSLMVLLLVLNGHCEGTCILSVFFDFSLTVKAAPDECVIKTGQP